MAEHHEPRDCPVILLHGHNWWQQQCEYVGLSRHFGTETARATVDMPGVFELGLNLRIVRTFEANRGRRANRKHLSALFWTV
jgi:hypothetical protein